MHNILRLTGEVVVDVVLSSGLVRKSLRSYVLAHLASGASEMKWHQGETLKHQQTVRGDHQGCAHTDLIPVELKGKSCMPQDWRTKSSN